ncbi:hypothetical protein C5167_026561 [Papaver somniferum]|nr:hypothetical protein C5167_026561 [Papaver somniferum]
MSLENVLRCQESENSKKHYDIGYHFKAACCQTGCLLVRQFFFHNNPKNFADLRIGVLGCRGLHFSFRATESGLNIVFWALQNTGLLNQSAIIYGFPTMGLGRISNSFFDYMKKEECCSVDDPSLRFAASYKIQSQFKALFLQGTRSFLLWNLLKRQ